MKLRIADMEKMAKGFRANLGVEKSSSLDPLKIRIKDIEVITLEKLGKISEKEKNYLLIDVSQQWSAMSVPLDETFKKWVIVRNHENTKERQNVSILEEYWHILLEHQLTKIIKFGKFYGRSFESDEEHDAYYLASATLLPQTIIKKFVDQNNDIQELAVNFSVSTELIEYRIKRLGLWSIYKSKSLFDKARISLIRD